MNPVQIEEARRLVRRQRERMAADRLWAIRGRQTGFKLKRISSSPVLKKV